MPSNTFIAGDWGTSNLRLYLCTVQSGNTIELLDTRYGSGIRAVKGDFEEHFFNLAQDWIAQHGKIPVLLSGMIGSNIGWKEAPYLRCPVDAGQIANGRKTFSARGMEFSILSGIKTSSPLGVPDVMRGEELQILGWLKSNSEQAGQTRLFALPGTHNKWALVENASLTTFLTAFTGELFALLRKQSILITDESAIDFNKEVFIEGLATSKNANHAQLVHSLFSTRSRQVLGEMAGTDALSYLSGLITGADVQGASATFADITDGERPYITIIGEPTLAEQYLIACEYLKLEAESCDPASIALSGFEAVYQHLN